MKTLQSYFIRETFRPFALVTVVLGALAMLTQSLATMDIIVDDQASFFTYLEITLLALPQLISTILPFALFLAVAYAVQHLHTDNEFLVVFAGGMTKWAVISPIMRIACLVVLANLTINTWVQPAAYKTMRESIYKVRSDLASTIVRPGEFVSPALNLTIFAREVQNDVLSDVMIYDGRNRDNPMIYLAKTGTFINTGLHPLIALTNTTRQRVDADGALETLEFTSTNFALQGVIEPQGALIYKRTDRYLGELFHPDPSNYWDRQNADSLLAEGHLRLSSPLYNFTLALMALAALLGGDYNRMGYGKRLVFTGALALMIRLIGYSIEAAAAEYPVLNVAQYAIPLAVAALCLWFVLSEKRLSRPDERLAIT